MTTLRKLPMSRPKTKTKPATTYGDRYSIQAFQLSLLLRLPESVNWIKLARRSIVKLGKRRDAMKILQVCSASEMGGGEVHVADLVRALASRGHAVYLAVRPNSPLRAPLAGVIASWHELPLKNSLDVYSSRAIADLIDRHGIHIVHAHVGRDYLVAALACRNAQNCRLVLTRHHYLPLKNNPVYRWLLGKAAAFIAVSEPVRASLVERLG